MAPRAFAARADLDAGGRVSAAGAGPGRLAVRVGGALRVSPAPATEAVYAEAGRLAAGMGLDVQAGPIDPADMGTVG